MNMIQHSKEIKAGLRQGFQDGTSKLAQRKCYGYEVSADGELVINEKEAEVVRWIFEQYADGKSLGKIADGLARQGIPSPTCKERWSRETISKLLRNEKYTGNILLQKTYGTDVLSCKRAKNRGELPRYLIEQHHPAIVSRELFETANRTEHNKSPIE